jgi:hypothetical protein
MTVTGIREIMSDTNIMILEELLLSETFLEQDDSAGTELESLLNEEHEAENGLFIDVSNSLEYGSEDCSYKSQHSVEIVKDLPLAVREENNEFEIMEDFYEESCVLAQVLSDCDGDSDEDEDDEQRDASIHMVHNKRPYLSALKRAGRREQKYRVEINSNQLAANEPLEMTTDILKPLTIKPSTLLFQTKEIIADSESAVITAVHVNSSFISIGTACGSVKLYNHDQNVEHIFEHSHDDVFGAVTAIDVCNLKYLLACGYGDEGITALWSFGAKCGTESLLMYINDLNKISILSLKFISPLLVVAVKKDTVATVLSADCSGAIYRLVITKSMWSSEYAFESECLLVGSTSKSGATVEDLSILSPLHHFKQFSSPLSSINTWQNIEIMAFSNHSKTFIVQLRPRVLILFRWSHSSSSLSPSPSPSIGVDKISSSVSSLLDWSWGSTIPPSESEAGYDQHHPLLLRSWGSVIQVMF